jgi:FecR protein
VKRLPPSSIPPLSDSGLHRIERGVFSALDAPAPLMSPLPARSGRRRFIALSLAAATAVAVIGVRVQVGFRQGRRGETASGRAQVTTTTSGSRIAIAGAALEIAPNSAVSFGVGKDGAMVVVLDRGAVTCDVAPRTNRAPFIVEAGATRVTVIGTRFTVRRLGEHASVSVEHGLVEVADTNMTELVRAGESFRPGEPVTREPLATEAQVPAPVVVVAPVVAAPIAIATPNVVAAPKVAASAPAPHRTHERHVAMASAADVVVASPSTLAASEAPVATPTNDAPVVEAPAAVAPPESESAARRASTQVLFELAAQLEVRDPATALSIYGQLAAGDDAWAASALFASARLEAERNRARIARDLSEAYLRRFPRGPNADDARALLDALR